MFGDRMFFNCRYHVPIVLTVCGGSAIAFNFKQYEHYHAQSSHVYLQNNYCVCVCANSIQKPLPVTKGKQLLPQNACPSDLWQDILGDGGGYGLIILSFNDFSTGPAGHLQMFGLNKTWDIGHLDQNCSLCTLSKICPLVKTPWTANGTPLSSHMQWHTRC